MPITYYGSKLSENMTLTPEGYLICRNVPIGRTGWMDYLGEELGLEDKRGQVIKVYRSPEELFSKATIASFEGKPVTNNHPSQSLDVNTVGMMLRGHVENVRPEGDYLIGDLYMIDSGLISEVDNGKREVSSGYDCLWIPLDDGGFEQKQIVGNHVAVVQNGRAGSKVSIKDSTPEQLLNQNERSNKPMAKVTLRALAALGFKHFAKDAEPEEIEKAMDAMGEEEAPAEQQKEDETSGKILEAIAQLGEAVKSMGERLDALEKSDEQVHKEVGADEEMANLEKEVEGGFPEDVQDSEESETVEPEETKDAEPEEEKEGPKPATDSAALIQMMKPIIMGIKDEKERNLAAKQFAKAVRDSRATSVNGYGSIINTVAGNKKHSMDTQAQQKQTQTQATELSCSNWNKNNAQIKGVQ